MDPNETLREIRDLAFAVLNTDDPAASTAHALAARVSDLDEWLTRGGFLPDSWKPTSYDSNPATPRKEN